MQRRDPIAAYVATSNEEAHLICQLLATKGIDAYPTEDVSQVGHFIAGFLPNIHKPQVWIDKADIEKATPILEAYHDEAIRRGKISSTLTSEGAIQSVCEDCQRESRFLAEQDGTVQECPHCGAYMDVVSEAQSAESLDE